MTAFAKHFDLLSPVFLARVRLWGCFWAGPACGGLLVQAHHHPPKSRLGCTDDTLVVGACLAHHAACHGQRVVVGEHVIEPIDEAEQAIAVDRTFARFFREAPWIEVEQVVREMRRRAERRGDEVAW